MGIISVDRIHARLEIKKKNITEKKFFSKNKMLILSGHWNRSCGGGTVAHLAHNQGRRGIRLNDFW